MAVQVFTKTGNKSPNKATLSKSVFSIEVKNYELLQAAYQTAASNTRSPIARTKTRGEVRGGGRKPWRQKGTGRARFGSSRNPIWRGGGIVFGPRAVENYHKKLNKSARRIALAQALSLAAEAGRIVVLEAFESKDGRVKPTAELLSKMELSDKKVLLVVPENDDLVKRAIGNLPQVTAAAAQDVSVMDILNAEVIVLTKKSIDTLELRAGVAS